MLLVAPFAAATVLRKPAVVQGRKWGKYWPGMNITRQSFREALEAEQRVLESSGLTDLKPLLNKVKEAVRVSTKRAVLEEVNGGIYDEFLEPGFKERIAYRNYVYDPT